MELFLHDIFLAQKVRDMADPDHGHNSHITLYDHGDPVHLSKLGDAHFDHARLRLRIGFGDCNGNAALRVGIALCTVCPKSSGQSRGDHLPRRRLSDGTGHPDIGNVNIAAAVIGTEILQGLHRIFHADQGMTVGIEAVGDPLRGKGCCRTLQKRIADKLMRVHARPDDRYEKIRALHLAGRGRYILC